MRAFCREALRWGFPSHVWASVSLFLAINLLILISITVFPIFKSSFQIDVDYRSLFVAILEPPADARTVSDEKELFSVASCLVPLRCEGIASR